MPLLTQTHVRFIATILLLMLVWPLSTSGAVDQSRKQAFASLKAGTSSSVRELPAGDREIMMAKILLDNDDTESAIKLLSTSHLAGNELAAVIKAEAYRRQSVKAAVRAGNYAHSVTGDIDKLKNARLSAGLDEAERRLQAFIAHKPATTQPVKVITLAKPDAPKTAVIDKSAALLDSIRTNLEQWRKDWESRKPEPYLSHYHPRFATDKYNLASWSSYKRRVNGSKSFIQVGISNIKILRGPEPYATGEGVLISYHQQYKSNNYAANSSKQLYLIRENDSSDWKILYEGDNSGSYHPKDPQTRADATPTQIKPEQATATPATSDMQTPPSTEDESIIWTNRESWTVNIGAFDSWANAEQMAANIRKDTEYKPFVATIFGDNGEQLHRVRLGPYKSQSEAIQSMISACHQLDLLDCWIQRID